MKKIRIIRQIIINIALGIFLISSILLTIDNKEDIPSVISAFEFTILFGWFTLLTYGAGWVVYFKKRFYARLLICDVPFILSVSFMAFLNFTTYQNTEGLDIVLMTIYMWPLFAYFPLTLIYYSILIMGFDILNFDIKRDLIEL